jgi:prepilin-type N-terminal cleavage/methylation domain-containing protein
MAATRPDWNDMTMPHPRLSLPSARRACMRLGRCDSPFASAAFTLVELLVVMAIIALVLALLVPAIAAAIRAVRSFKGGA